MAQENITIIGAGIIGISAAIWAQRAGYDVRLIDRAGPGSNASDKQASFGNAGLLSPSSVVPVVQPGMIKSLPKMLFDKNSPLFVRWSYALTHLPWMLRFLSHARPKAAARAAQALKYVTHDCVDQHLILAAGTDAHGYIASSDLLYGYRDRAAFLAEKSVWDIRARCGFDWQEMNRQELADYDALLGAAFGFAICERDNGYITDPGAYVSTLLRHFVMQGGALISGEALGFDKADGKVRAVITAKGRFACDHLIVCCGAWSTGLAHMLGTRVRVESERGYHIELVNPSIVPRAPTVVAAGGFVMTPMASRLRCAGIVEIGGLSAPPSRAPFELLRRQVHAALPGITYDSIGEWMGHRPITVDSIPVIGRTGAFANAYLGFGHHSIGLTGGAKTGRVLVQLISGQVPNADMSLLSPARFE